MVVPNLDQFPLQQTILCVDGSTPSITISHTKASYSPEILDTTGNFDTVVVPLGFHLPNHLAGTYTVHDTHHTTCVHSDPCACGRDPHSSSGAKRPTEPWPGGPGEQLTLEPFDEPGRWSSQSGRSSFAEERRPRNTGTAKYRLSCRLLLQGVTTDHDNTTTTDYTYDPSKADQGVLLD